MRLGQIRRCCAPRAVLLTAWASVMVTLGCHPESASGAPPDASASPGLAAARPAGFVVQGRVRAAVHAGSWYSADAEQLRAIIHDWMESAPGPLAPLGGTPVAVVAPHAGLRYSGAVAAAAYKPLSRDKPKRVFVLGPSHQEAFLGIALPAAEISAFATPLGQLPVDQVALAALRGQPGFEGPARAHEREHSLELQLPFISYVAPNALIVPLLVGRTEGVASAARLADAIRPLLGPGDVVVVSSDFTHFGASYGYVPFTTDVPGRLARLADGAAQALARADAKAFASHLATTGDTICGREPLAVLLALLPSGSDGTRLWFDMSGRTTADWQTSVSYVAMVYTRAGGLVAAPSAQAAQVAIVGPSVESARSVLEASGQALALKMARRTLELVLASRPVPDEAALEVPSDPVWRTPLGTFVTLTKHGELRGCIGHIQAVQALWRDIRDNAVAAALADSRFAAVTAAELSLLDIEVSVLTPMRRVGGSSDIEVGRHGVVLTAQGRRAVFLPQVAVEQGWSRDTMLSQLARKAGLAPGVWREPGALFDVFEAQVFGEPKRADARP